MGPRKIERESLLMLTSPQCIHEIFFPWIIFYIFLTMSQIQLSVVLCVHEGRRMFNHQFWSWSIITANSGNRKRDQYKFTIFWTGNVQMN